MTTYSIRLGLCTATKIPLMYSFSCNSAASAPISTFVCLWAIYVFPGSVHIFPTAEKADTSWEYMYNSLTDTWMWKLGLTPRYSFSGNICFEISVFCLCSVPSSTGYIIAKRRGLWSVELSCKYNRDSQSIREPIQQIRSCSSTHQLITHSPLFLNFGSFLRWLPIAFA